MKRRWRNPSKPKKVSKHKWQQAWIPAQNAVEEILGKAVQSIGELDRALIRNRIEERLKALGVLVYTWIKLRINKSNRIVARFCARQRGPRGIRFGRVLIVSPEPILSA